MRTQPETRARSAQEAGKRALNLGASKANQACSKALCSRPKQGDIHRRQIDGAYSTLVARARRAVLAEHGD